MTWSPLQTRADEIALNSTISGARFSSGSSKGWAFTVSSPVLVTQLGPWDQGNNRLKTVSCRNRLDQHRHADGTSLLCPPHFVFDTPSISVVGKKKPVRLPSAS